MFACLFLYLVAARMPAGTAPRADAHAAHAGISWPEFTPDAIKNHPALKGLTIPKTGQAGSVGVLVTKTLVIAGDPGFNTYPERGRGAMLRAYNKQTGEQVGAVWMPAPQSGSPMTYSVNGKQYIIVAVSGANYSGEYVAFALP